MRASRLVQLLLLLQANGRMTAAQLAERLEVSVRTIYRDLDALSSAGVPVSTIAYGTPDGTVRVGGELIPVPVDADALERLAQSTEGTAFAAESGEELDQVYEDIGGQVGTTTEVREITARFAGIGLALTVAAVAAALAWGARLP